MVIRGWNLEHFDSVIPFACEQIIKEKGLQVFLQNLPILPFIMSTDAVLLLTLSHDN